MSCVGSCKGVAVRLRAWSAFSIGFCGAHALSSLTFCALNSQICSHFCFLRKNLLLGFPRLSHFLDWALEPENLGAYPFTQKGCDHLTSVAFTSHCSTVRELDYLRGAPQAYLVEQIGSVGNGYPKGAALGRILRSCVGLSGRRVVTP